jgi:hypothetical protein
LIASRGPLAERPLPLAVAHAHRVVEDEHRRGLHLLGEGEELAADERPRQQQRQQRHHRDAQDHEEQFASLYLIDCWASDCSMKRSAVKGTFFAACG